MDGYHHKLFKSKLINTQNLKVIKIEDSCGTHHIGCLDKQITPDKYPSLECLYIKYNKNIDFKLNIPNVNIIIN